MKAKMSPKNVREYFIGNIRHFIYYRKKLRWLIREHILQQVRYRVKKMDSECFHQGSCIKCGCKTINLQFANKACDGNCYPKMMNKKEWMKYVKSQPLSEIEIIYKAIF